MLKKSFLMLLFLGFSFSIAQAMPPQIPKYPGAKIIDQENTPPTGYCTMELKNGGSYEISKWYVKKLKAMGWTDINHTLSDEDDSIKVSAYYPSKNLSIDITLHNEDELVVIYITWSS